MVEPPTPGSLGSLREENRRRLVETLLEQGAASRADLARLTGLSRTTVSTLVSQLETEGLVAEREMGVPHGAHAGRPPVLVAFERSAGAVVGIDFGHSHLAVAVADLSHTVLAERWREMDVDHEAKEGLDAAADLVEQVLSEAGVDRERVIGVGLGLPGPVSSASGAIGSTAILPGWVGVEAGGEMSARLGLPVHVENDANLGALAETMWGAGRGASEVVYIKVSSGIGGGLIVGGRLYHGKSGTAGEIGHTLIADGRGALCRCGNRGCLETVAAAGVIVGELGAGRGEELTIAEVVELAAGGDAPARRVLGDAGRQIGVALANLCNLLNPERVIVGGEVSAAGDVLLDPLRDALRRNAIPAAAEDVEAVAGELGKRAELMGALSLALRESNQTLSVRLPASTQGSER